MFHSPAPTRSNNFIPQSPMSAWCCHCGNSSSEKYLPPNLDRDKGSNQDLKLGQIFGCPEPRSPTLLIIAPFEGDQGSPLCCARCWQISYLPRIIRTVPAQARALHRVFGVTRVYFLSITYNSRDCFKIFNPLETIFTPGG